MSELLSWSSLAALGLGYLVGSIPFGVVLTRLAGLGDIRSIGSGSIGATNVLRTGRKGIAAATLLGDGLKGTVAVLLAGTLFAAPAALVAGLGAFLGHLFPVWLGFRGGKGVATYLGVLAALAWPAAIVFALVWVGIAAISRFSSASGLAASLATPPALLLVGDRPTALLFVILTVILWQRHADNIRRLAAGTESRIGEQR
ncbi:MAG: glycerol-3-phosphate 1-O-acyltransferase PlsY [Bauldia sp.]